MPVPADSHKELLHQERKSVALPGPGCFSPSSTCTASQAAAEVISVSPGLLELRGGASQGLLQKESPLSAPQFFMPLQPRPQQSLNQLQVTVRSSDPKPLSCPSPLQDCVGVFGDNWALDCVQHRQVFGALHPIPTPSSYPLYLGWNADPSVV